MAAAMLSEELSVYSVEALSNCGGGDINVIVLLCSHSTTMHNVMYIYGPEAAQ